MPNKFVLLVARVLLAAIFIVSGFGKLTDPASTAGMIQQAGLPAATALTYIAGLFELITGICVVIGFQTTIIGWLLALFCLFTGFVFHGHAINVPDFPAGANGLLTMFNQIMLMKNIALAGGFLVLASFGPGELSVDGRKSA